MLFRSLSASLLSLLAVLVLVTGCSSSPKGEAKYPTGMDRNMGSDQNSIYEKPKSILGGDSGSIFSRKKKDDDNSGIGVNSFLWRASLDTVSFMPLASADPFGGVILTDWYAAPETPNERIKLNVFILDKQLRSDGIEVKVFKQTRKGKGDWRDAPVADETARSIEDAILTRARQMRVAQIGEVR